MEETPQLTRLESTILYILKRAHDSGIDNLSRFELMKLVYLIEVNSQKFIGESFTHGVTFVRDTNGPISYDIYKANEHLSSMGLVKIEAQDNVDYGYPRYCHSLDAALPDLTFGESEAIFLNSVLDDYLGTTIANLKAVVYSTEPMVDIQSAEKVDGHIHKGQRIDLNAIPLDDDILASIMN